MEDASLDTVGDTDIHFRAFLLNQLDGILQITLLASLLQGSVLLLGI